MVAAGAVVRKAHKGELKLRNTIFNFWMCAQMNRTHGVCGKAEDDELGETAETQLFATIKLKNWSNILT